MAEVRRVLIAERLLSQQSAAAVHGPRFTIPSRRLQRFQIVASKHGNPALFDSTKKDGLGDGRMARYFTPRIFVILFKNESS